MTNEHDDTTLTDTLKESTIESDVLDHEYSGLNDELFLCHSGSNLIGPARVDQIVACVQLGYLDVNDTAIPYESDTDENTVKVGDLISIPSEPRRSALVKGSEAVDKSKNVADNLKKGVDAMKSYTEFANKLQQTKALDTIGKVNDLTDKLQMLSKFSAALGVAGAVLGVTSTLLPSGPDPQMMIMKMLSELFNEIQKLGTQIDELETVMKLEHAKLAVVPHVDMLQTIASNVAAYQSVLDSNGNDPVLRKVIDEKLRFYTPKDISIAINGIVANCAVGDRNGSVHFDIFKALYNASHGNLNQILGLGGKLANLVAMGILADGLISLLRWKYENGEPVTQEEKDAEKLQINAISVANEIFYKGYLIKIQEGISYWSDRCKDDALINIMQQLDSKLLDASINPQRIVTELKDNYNWYDFFSINYYHGQGDKEGITHQWLPGDNGNKLPDPEAKLMFLRRPDSKKWYLVVGCLLRNEEPKKALGDLLTIQKENMPLEGLFTTQMVNGCTLIYDKIKNKYGQNVADNFVIGYIGRESGLAFTSDQKRFYGDPTWMHFELPHKLQKLPHGFPLPFPFFNEERSRKYTYGLYVFGDPNDIPDGI